MREEALINNVYMAPRLLLAILVSYRFFFLKNIIITIIILLVFSSFDLLQQLCNGMALLLFSSGTTDLLVALR